MKTLFGYLFLIVNVILVSLQTYNYIILDVNISGRIALFIILSMGSLLGAVMIYSDHSNGRRMNSMIAGAIGLLLCLALIVIMAFNAMSSSKQITGRYSLFIIYALFYGIYGYNGIVKK